MLKPLSSLQKKNLNKTFLQARLNRDTERKKWLVYEGVLTGSNLKEGKILILVDLHCKDRVSRGLS